MANSSDEAQGGGSVTDATVTGTAGVDIEALMRRANDAVAQIEQQRAEVAAAAAEADAKVADSRGKFAVVEGALAKIAAAESRVSSMVETIDSTNASASEMRAQAEASARDAAASAGATATAKARSEAIANDLRERQPEIAQLRASAESDGKEIGETKNAAKAAATALKKLAEESEQVDERLLSYRKELETLIISAKAQLAAIEGLLPGATSAGLASAFDARRGTFGRPSKRWQWIYILSVVAIAVVAGSSVWHTLLGGGVTLTWNELLRMWLSRLPVVGALIWLALHSGRESALAKRLEEDYGYKAAIAASFQGFHKQMTELGALKGTPLGMLCQNTLAELANSPGRIYDKHKLTISPADELLKLIRVAPESVRDALTLAAKEGKDGAGS